MVDLFPLYGKGFGKVRVFYELSTFFFFSFSGRCLSIYALCQTIYCIPSTSRWNKYQITENHECPQMKNPVSKGKALETAKSLF